MNNLYNKYKTIDVFNFKLAAFLLAGGDENLAPAWFEQLKHDATEGLLPFDPEITRDKAKGEWVCRITDPSRPNERLCSYVIWKKSKVTRDNLTASCEARGHSPASLFGGGTDAEDTVGAPEKGPSYVGRPSVMAAVIQEMNRRNEADPRELLPTITKEAKHLVTWAEKKFPGVQTPKMEGMRNSIRRAGYQSLKTPAKETH